jgi:hypothetical protein
MGIRHEEACHGNCARPGMAPTPPAINFPFSIGCMDFGNSDGTSRIVENLVDQCRDSSGKASHPQASTNVEDWRRLVAQYGFTGRQRLRISKRFDSLRMAPTCS